MSDDAWVVLYSAAQNGPLPDHSGVVTYFLFNPATSLVKIGRSTNFKDRLQTISMMAGVNLQVLGLLEGDHERAWHQRCHKNRVLGEWFDPTPRTSLEKALRTVFKIRTRRVYGERPEGPLRKSLKIILTESPVTRATPGLPIPRARGRLSRSSFSYRFSTRASSDNTLAEKCHHLRVREVSQPPWLWFRSSLCGVRYRWSFGPHSQCPRPEHVAAQPGGERRRSSSALDDTDGELFWKITTGRGAMPAWQHLPESDRSAVVQDIPSLGGK